MTFDLARAKRLLAEGRSMRAVAKLLGVGKSTLCRAVPQAPLVGAPQVRVQARG